MKAFLFALIIFAGCTPTKPKPEAWLVSEDPGIIIYPNDPERVLKICDSVNQIRITRLQATVDSLLEIPKGYSVYVYDSASQNDLHIQVIRKQATIDSLQDIISHGHQSIFFSEHGAVLANQRQAVDVGIYYNAKVGFVFFYCRRNVSQVFGQRLRIMRKMPSRSAKKFHHIRHPQLF